MAHANDHEGVVVEQYAKRDPIAAVKALAHGMSRQPSGAQLAALRLFAEALVRRDPDRTRAEPRQQGAELPLERLRQVHQTRSR
jgi:hypothetical protein